MDYKDALLYALHDKDFVSNYDRITGNHLGRVIQAMKENRLNHIIDVSTGRFKSEIQKFDDFVFETIWKIVSQDTNPKL